MADGRAVVLRLAGPGHVPAITRLYRDLSPESFYGRFHAGQMAPSLLARLASIGGGTVCLVAAPPAEPGRLAAEARYVPVGSGTAELALTVRDGYQGAGMGRLLLGALVERARADGLERLRAVVLLSNTAMLRLLQRYGWVLAAPVEEFSVACLEISAAGGMPGWPAGSAGQRVLVERRSWFDDQQVAALRSAGNDVRQCTGPPSHRPGLPAGHLRAVPLAEQADLIVSLLPGMSPTARQCWPPTGGTGRVLGTGRPGLS